MDILVIGGGASGMLASLEAAALGAHVTLLEKEARVGKKLLMTGNGRCNLLNSAPQPNAYHGGGAAVAHTLVARIPPAAVLKRFERIGLYAREEEEGRVYPLTGQAASVLDALRFALDREGVDVRTGCEAVRAVRQQDGFEVYLATGEAIRTPRLLLATGGAAQVRQMGGYALAQMLGHRITPLRPAISQLRTPTQAVRGLKGVRAHGRLTLWAGEQILRQETGEVLFAEYGLSGVAAMQCARQAGDALLAGQAVSIGIDLLPEWTIGTVHTMLADRFALWHAEPMTQFFTGLLHKRVGERLLSVLQISPTALAGDVSASEKKRLALLLKDWRLPIEGIAPLASAQVTAGGLAVDEWSPDTLASRKVPGLYAAGELLDVDGDCGGYNLLWAWVSALTAGAHAARAIKEGMP